jgi:type IV secretion system protein VirD4
MYIAVTGLTPFFSPKYDLKKHPNYKHTAEADKRNYKLQKDSQQR